MRLNTLPRVPRDAAAVAFLAFRSRTPDEPAAIALPEDPTQLSDDDLTDLEARAVAEFDAIKAIEDPTDEDVERARQMTEVIKGARSESTRRETAAADRRNALDTLSAEVAGEEDGDGEDGTDGEDTDGADGADSDAESGAGDDAPVEEDAPADRTPALVAGGATTRPRVSQVARRTSTPKPPKRSKPRMSLVAAADVPHVQQGHQYVDLNEVAEAVGRRMETYPKRRTPSRTRLQNGIAVLSRDFPAALVADVNGGDVLNYATDQSRLPNGSLIAAGGWCAPSETLYEFAEIEGTDGLLDVPEVQARRGGINFTPGPDFRAIYDGSGFYQTEAEAIAGTENACYEVPCPAFSEVRADVAGVCITSGILQNKAYPELTARVIRGSLAAHAHKVSARSIGKMVAGSGAAVVLPEQEGAAGPLLNAFGLAATDVRYRHRMPKNGVLEVVLPMWILEAVRADVAFRNGVDMMAVTDEQIRAWFTARKVAPQFVYDWQDSAIGQAAAAKVWPATVDFLMYPAGTWVRGHENVITLDTVYDSAGLKQNRYTGLFTEESLLMAKTGHDSRLYRVPISPNGVTAEQLPINVPVGP